MATALIGGLLDSGIPNSLIKVVDPDPHAGQRLKTTFGIEVSDHLTQAISEVDLIVLAVKPQTIPEVLATLKPYLTAGTARPVILSIASGVGLDHFEQVLGTRPIIRAMPNTPALVGQGVTAMVGNDALTDEAKAWASDLMGRVGQCLWLSQEEHMDTVTALSGSGPAYFFALAEHMVAAGTAQGLERSVAEKLVYQTALGAGTMLSQSDEGAKVLRERVTSPGGTTQAALSVFSDHALADTVRDAVAAARQRSQELGQSHREDSTKEH